MILIVTVILFVLILLVLGGVWFKSPRYSNQIIQPTVHQRDFRVVYTLSPDNLETLDIQKLLNNSINPDWIYLNVSLDQFIPPNFKYDKVTITKCEGPMMKLLPTLKKETDPNTIIISIGDGDDHEELLHNILRSTKIAYAYQSTQDNGVIILNDTAIYQRNFFTDDIFDVIKSEDSDKWISLHLANNGIQRVQLRNNLIE